MKRRDQRAFGLIQVKWGKPRSRLLTKPLEVRHRRCISRRGWDSNPRLSFPNTRFRGELFRPLRHLSLSSLTNGGIPHNSAKRKRFDAIHSISNVTQLDFASAKRGRFSTITPFQTSHRSAFHLREEMRFSTVTPFPTSLRQLFVSAKRWLFSTVTPFQTSHRSAFRRAPPARRPRRLAESHSGRSGGHRGFPRVIHLLHELCHRLAGLFRYQRGPQKERRPRFLTEFASLPRRHPALHPPVLQKFQAWRQGTLRGRRDQPTDRFSLSAPPPQCRAKLSAFRAGLPSEQSRPQASS